MLKGHVAGYLKKHTRLLVQDVGVRGASRATGKSTATLGRYCSDASDNIERFMPIDAVVRLEIASSQPHVTRALAELKGLTIGLGKTDTSVRALGVHFGIVDLSQRFATLMRAYNRATTGDEIRRDDAHQMICEAEHLHLILTEMKVFLEKKAARSCEAIVT